MFVQLDKKKVKEFQGKILGWYEVNKRDLPWRRTRDPYRILVSEVMLQQTQVSRVLPKYEEWLGVFPTVEALAGATSAEVLRVWSGLGYNRRALYLQRCAQEILMLNDKWPMTNGKGEGDNEKVMWPETEEGLMRLPGVGKYTARAILCFAFGKEVAVVDTNVKKVILLEVMGEFNSKFKIQSSKPQPKAQSFQAGRQAGVTEKEVWEIAEGLVPVGRAYEWNQGLMDYASAVLRQEKIPVPKQSAFLGSRRYYRGKLVRLLLEKGKMSVRGISEALEKDVAWVEGLAGDLEREGFVVVEEGEVRLE